MEVLTTAAAAGETSGSASEPAEHTESSMLDDLCRATEELCTDDVTGGEENDTFVLSSSVLSHDCSICNKRLVEPRVLHCLHVFCSGCLLKIAEHGENAAIDPIKVICPSCKQATRLQTGVEELPLDIVLINMMDVADIGECLTVCTSCKAGEKAVARCSDCCSFLCPNCVTAHNYMRCFENHKVESFEELQKDGGLTIHKPIFCTIHPVEQLKFFCNTCQVPVCPECMVGVHKLPEHICMRITDADTKHVDDLRALMADAKNKMAVCKEASGDLDSLLAELQQQKESARDLVTETFHSYKAALEKRKDEMLQELDSVHSTSELSIMDKFNDIEKTLERIDDGCKFTERVLEHGNMAEVLAVKKQITRQMLKLINNIPTPHMNIKIEFISDTEKFERVMKSTFGYIQREDDGTKHSMSPASSLLTPVGVPDFIPSHLNTMNSHHLASSSDVIASMAAFSSGHTRGAGDMPCGGQFVGSGSGMDRSVSRNSSYSPAMSDSGISVDAAGTGGGVAGNPLPPINLAMLAKLGNIGVNNQGQITVNGQVLPGLNLSNIANLLESTGTGGHVGQSGAGPTRGQTPLPPLSAGSLSGLLNSVGGMSPPSATGGMGPSGPLSDLNAVFMNSHQPFVSGAVGSSMTSPVSAITGMHSQPPPTNPLMNGSGVAPPMSLTPPMSSDGQSGFLRPRTAAKISAMQIRCKFGQLGPGKGQFNSPHGFCLGMDEDIVVADTNNHRIQIFEKTGDFKYQFGVPGREEGQLWYPRKVAVIRTSGKYVVCDRGNERSRMQLFTKNGQFIKKIAIRYIDIVAGLAITAQGHIVAVDSVSPTVFCIAESGDLIKWFDCSDYMREPSDIAVSGKEYYVCDFKGHCVVVFNENGEFVHRIGCENITNYPNGIDISDAGDVLIGDSHGNRFHVAVFQRDGSLIGEFECPYVKVSRCCGLKITSEGYVVTLAKNNQHVLVLNTLYIA